MTPIQESDHAPLIFHYQLQKCHFSQSNGTVDTMWLVTMLPGTQIFHLRHKKPAGDKCTGTIALQVGDTQEGFSLAKTEVLGLGLCRSYTEVRRDSIITIVAAPDLGKPNY